MFQVYGGLQLLISGYGVEKIKQVKKSKKGIFFTMIAIVLTATLVLSFSIYNYHGYNDRIKSVETRIITMNNFIKDIEQDIEEGVYISSFRALLSIESTIASNGTYLKDTNADFREVFLNGTLDQKNLTLMNDSTINDWIEKIRIEAEKIGIITNFTVTDVAISHENPWKVYVQVDFDFIVNDIKQTSSWNINKVITSNISILDLEDPLYLVNSDGRVTNTFRISPFDTFVSGNDYENLNLQINNSYYINSTDAPSYLMRLEGNFSNSTYGIESLVDLNEFISQSIPTLQRSGVDYIYFGNQTTSNYRINNTPSWFYLGENNLETYDVAEHTI